MRHLAVLLAAGLLAGCGAETGDSPRSAGLEIDQRFSGDMIYIEGSLSYVRLEGATAVERALENGRAQLELVPGRYTLHSWQRPCDGNCDHLGSPRDRCSASFEAEAGARLRAAIVVRPGRGCSIDVR